MTARAKELADLIFERPLSQKPEVFLEVGRALVRLAAIEAAVPDEVREIQERVADTRAGFLSEAHIQAHQDRATLLAIVQKQAERIDSLEESHRHNPAVDALYRDAATLQQERDAARAEAEQLKAELSASEMDRRELRSMLAIANDKLDKRTQELAAAEDAARAEKQRADRLGRGISVYREHWNLNHVGTAEKVIAWEEAWQKEHGR